ncbi:MAG: AarF/UbiB family protein, partial [bacterium]
MGREGRERAAGRVLRRFCTTLGATFIKVGQILSSRADLLPHPLLEELAKLQDQVPAFPFQAVRQTIASELGRPLEEVYDRFDTEPVAAGSVAQVHRAVLRVSGDDVAVKVLRPDIAERIRLDRALLLLVARLLERVIPSLRLVSLEAAVQEFCRAVEGQLDFVREAESAARMRANFADDLDLLIPRTFPEASSRAVLTMEWLDGLKLEKLAGSAADMRAVMRTIFRYVGRSIFVHSFLHADIHPGNLRFRPPGRVVAFDFGLMAELTDAARVDFTRWGFGMATGDGKAVAKLFYDQAARREVASYDAYEAEMSALVAELGSRTVSEIPGMTVLARLFDILRRYRVQVGSQLTIVYLGVMSAEGLAKQIAPDLIFFEEMLPYLAEGLGLVPGSPSKQRPTPITAPESATQPESFAAGRYRSIRLLGEGARKRVYLARDATLGRDVALGFLKATKLDHVSLVGFQLEARVMAKLSDHPGIVAVYDFGVEEHGPYLVSEYMAGGTLAELLESREGKLVSIPETLRIGEQICQALAHAHEHGVVHRDVKPGNVWLTADGLAKLGDFGLSTASDLLRPGEERALSGTVAYMCPEQALGKAADPRSDLYALGCVLYEMLTGAPPFAGSDPAAIIARHLDTPPIPPSARNAGISPELDALVLRCLAKRPADRPESAAVLAEALSQIADAIGAAQSISPLDRLESGVFIGRDQEMKQLRAGLEEAVAGRGRLFLLAGEPGIGKTRTAMQLARDARRRGLRVLIGRCYEGEGAPAFWPWLQILRGYVLNREPAALEAELGASAADIAQLVPEVRERLPHLVIAVVQEGEAARFRLFDAVTRFVKQAAAAQPLVLILDDLHWADKSSLLLLQFLVGEMEQSRLFIAATYRDVEVLHGHPLAEVLPSLRRSHAHERIRLRGLAESDVRSLLGTLGGHEMPPDLARAVHRETEGNPFFVEEILAHLVEEDMLRWDGKQWVADRQREEIGLPESVREVIGRRVARLSERCRRVLTLASVIGREFDVGVLEHVADLGHEEIASALSEATAARVVAAMPRAVRHFRFAHALIRETLYGELGTAERVLLHRQTGEILEQVHGDAIEQHLSEIAHHFAEAAPGGDIEKAVSYAMRAAKTANAQLAFEEAARGYDQALKTLALRKPADELQRCRLLLELGEARFNGGEFERAKETFLAAAEIAEARNAPEELARAALGYGGLALVVFELTQPVDRLVVMLEKSLAALGESGESALRAQVMARLAVSLWNLEDRARRLTLAREALAMAKRVGDRNALGRVLLASTFVLWGPDNMEERLRVLEEATSPARA